MAELLKRILTANRPNVFISDLQVRLRRSGESVDLLKLKRQSIKSQPVQITLDDIANSKDLDTALAAGFVTLTDQDGIVLSTTEAIRATNLLTLHELDGADTGGGGSTTLIGLTDTPASYVGNAGQTLIVNNTEDGFIFADNITNFLGLTDTPSSYAGNAGQVPVINNTEDGLIFEDNPSTFLELPDTPSSYAGKTGQVPVVNIAEDGLVFQTVAGTGASGLVYSMLLMGG